MLAAWTAGAAVVILRANRGMKRAKALKSSLKRMQALLDISPALPLLVRVDGRIEAPDKLARLLGLATIPKYLSELAPAATVAKGGGQNGGLSPEQANQLWARVQATQKSAAPFRMAINLPGSQRSLALYGTLADPQVSPGGAALVWVFDFTESHAELARLRAAASRATGDFAALVGLIEAAPMPMWFRGSDLTLQLVNQAYVDAVGGEGAAEVVQNQIDLLEPEDGQTPAEIAGTSLASQGNLSASSPPPFTARGALCGSAICLWGRRAWQAMPSILRNSSRSPANSARSEMRSVRCSTSCRSALRSLTLKSA